MLPSLTLLLVFQLTGEIISRSFDLPVPGPVIGMILLFCALVLRGGPNDDMQETSHGILQHLSLLFVPAGTGVMVHLTRVGNEWLPLLVSLLVSTLLTLGVTALVMCFCKRLQRKGA